MLYNQLRVVLQVLALSVREAMAQAMASLQTGHVTAGMDAGVHGGHSTDGEPWQVYAVALHSSCFTTVLQEASQYQAKEEFSTLVEKVKLVRHVVM